MKLNTKITFVWLALLNSAFPSIIKTDLHVKLKQLNCENIEIQACNRLLVNKLLLIFIGRIDELFTQKKYLAIRLLFNIVRHFSVQPSFIIFLGTYFYTNLPLFFKWKTPKKYSKSKCHRCLSRQQPLLNGFENFLTVYQNPNLLFAECVN